MKIGVSMGVLLSFTLNYVKYANMESFAETVTYTIYGDTYILCVARLFCYLWDTPPKAK